MANRSRGALEEGSVVFNNETEKNITFDAASFQNVGFSSPPAVKLQSIGTPAIGQRNLIFDDRSRISPNYTHAELLTPTIGSAPATTNTVATKYSFLNNVTPKTKSKVIDSNEGITIPFSNAQFVESSKVQIFFQIRFLRFDDHVADGFRLGLVNKATIDQGTDATPIGSAETQELSYQLFINESAVWKSVSSGTDGYFYIDMPTINSAKSGTTSSSDFHWFRLDLSSGTESVADLSGLFIRNQADSNEKMFITNAMVVNHSSGNIPNSFDEASVIFGDVQVNSNILVSFTNVTTNGMKVITSAPFKGTIRYLCSTNG